MDNELATEYVHEFTARFLQCHLLALSVKSVITAIYITYLRKVFYYMWNRAGASGPAGPVLAGPILREKVGVFISRLHVGVAARSIVTQRCTKCKQLQRNAWGTLILGQADVPAVWNLR